MVSSTKIGLLKCVHHPHGISLNVGLMAAESGWEGGASLQQFVLQVGGLQSGLISQLLLRSGGRIDTVFVQTSLNPAGKAMTVVRLPAPSGADQ